MLPQIEWKRLQAGLYRFEDLVCQVDVFRLSAPECKAAGYPQCTRGWRMQFNRGGFHASAFLESLGAAQCNAARIIGNCRGTHDCYGNEKAKC